MELFDLISDVIRDRQVWKNNVNRRGITEYRPSHIGGFVESDIYNENVICSGDGTDLRSEVIVSLCVAATNANIPVIVLHQGDLELKQAFQKVYQQHPAYLEIAPNAKRFDPFFQLKNEQISKMIVDTAPQKYALTCDGEAYMDVLTRFLSERRRMITLKGLNECPHNKVPQLLASAAGKQRLPAEVIQELQVNLAQGQKEAYKIKAYLNGLYDECIQLLPMDKADYKNCVSIFQAVDQGAVLNMDIISDRNILLLKIIVEQLQMLIRRRIPFFLILDNLSICDENAMKTIVSVKSKGFGCAIVGDDVYSLCGGNEKLFGTLIGNSKKWFVFHHSSGISAEKWSSVFSKYQKIEATFNQGRGAGRGFGSGLSFGGDSVHGNMSRNYNKNYHQGVSYTNRDEAVIRADEILRLPERSGYVYTAATREIAHILSFLPQ